MGECVLQGESQTGVAPTSSRVFQCKPKDSLHLYDEMVLSVTLWTRRILPMPTGEVSSKLVWPTRNNKLSHASIVCLTGGGICHNLSFDVGRREYMYRSRR